MRVRRAQDHVAVYDCAQTGVVVVVVALDENTKTAAFLTACEHARQDRRAKEKALANPDMTPELAEVLSTTQLQLSYEITTTLTTE
ncbi:DUF7692 domain-containing protein [Halobacterium rubrum]|uniref:DUF7692 domain-containing protein n=1 Tax=Halobacterium TaxID=2239 RepID=UPI001F3D8A8C|nr:MULTISPECIES: hypothetical protein [Halobacterium]MDH5021687.1 hypothetical protein [Halobacterium rubrum]